LSTATAASPVKNVSVLSLSSSSITWGWEPAGNEKEFFAELYTTTTTPYSKLQDFGWTQTTLWIITELQPNTSYYIFVKTRNMFNVDTTTKSLLAATQIEPPEGVIFDFVENNKIKFSVLGNFTNFGIGQSKIFVSTTDDSGPYDGNNQASNKDEDYYLFNS
jgi:hypothetical protein